MNLIVIDGKVIHKYPAQKTQKGVDAITLYIASEDPSPDPKNPVSGKFQKTFKVTTYGPVNVPFVENEINCNDKILIQGVINVQRVQEGDEKKTEYYIKAEKIEKLAEFAIERNKIQKMEKVEEEGYIDMQKDYDYVKGILEE